MPIGLDSFFQILFSFPTKEVHTQYYILNKIITYFVFECIHKRIENG